MLAYPPMTVPVRLRDLPQASARTAGGDALGRAPALVFMDLVTDQQVEEALHPVLDVVGQRVAGLGPDSVRLPQWGRRSRSQVCFLRFRSASVRGTPSLSTICAVQSGQQGTRNGSPVSSSRNSLPLDTAHRSYHGGHPPVGQLGASHGDITAKRGPEPTEMTQPLQVGDGLDDDGAGAKGTVMLHLPLPLLGTRWGGQSTRMRLEARHVRRRGGDEGLAGAHLADDGGAPVGFEGRGPRP